MNTKFMDDNMASAGFVSSGNHYLRKHATMISYLRLILKEYSEV